MYMTMFVLSCKSFVDLQITNNCPVNKMIGYSYTLSTCEWIWW